MHALSAALLPLSLALPALSSAQPSAPLAGPVAVYYGAESTHLVDLGTGQRYVSPGFLSSHGERVWRYRLRVVIEPSARDDDGLAGPGHRWTVLERRPIDGQRWEPLTATPTLPAQGRLSLEHRVVQFQRDGLSLLSLQRISGAGLPQYRAQATQLSLPSGEPQAAPHAQGALQWLEGQLSGLLDPCVRQPAGYLHRQLAGGRPGLWLLLAGQEACADQLWALSLTDPTAPTLHSGGLRWSPPQLRSAEGDRDDIWDLRLSPERDFALLIGGPGGPERPAPIEAPILTEAFHSLARPCAEGQLWSWQAGGALSVLGSSVPLDGLWWPTAEDPLLHLIDTEFEPLNAPCHRPLSLDGRWRPVARRCRSFEGDRAWAGPGDLEGQIRAQLRGGDVIVEVKALDPVRRPGDGLRLWVGPGRQPLQLHAGPEGLQWIGKVRAAQQRGVRAQWQEAAQEGGYQVQVTLPRALLGSPPALTVRIDDEDEEGLAALWAGGEPISPERPAATPCEDLP